MPDANGVVWNGAEDLRALLRPIEAVTPSPRNPRRGDVPFIADSLRQFGQLKPIVVDDEGTIVAGNHVWMAIVEMLGWSHVAVVESGDPDTSRAYLVVDNVASDRARHDAELAMTMAREYMERAGGVSTDTGALLRQASELLARIGAGATAPDAFAVIGADGVEVTCRCAFDDCAYEWRS